MVSTIMLVPLAPKAEKQTATAYRWENPDMAES